MTRYTNAKSLLISILVGFTSLKTLLSFLFNIPFDLQINNPAQVWLIGEFLINYQSGFVRRGLPGEILFLFSTLTGCDPIIFITLFCIICFFGVIIFFFIQFKKKCIKWWIIPLSIFLANPCIIRKDYFFILSLITILYCYRSSWTTWIRLTVINVIVIVSILSHEAFFFVCVPLLCLIIIKDESISKSTIPRLLSCLPMLTTVVIVGMYHGNMQQAQEIQTSWVHLIGEERCKDLLDGSIGALDWSTNFAIKYHWFINFIIPSSLIPGFIIRPVAIILIFYFLTNFVRLFSSQKTAMRTNDFFYLLFFQFCSLLPLFTVLSCDTIRICMYWTASTFAFFLLFPESQVKTLFPEWYTANLDRIDYLITHNNFTKPRKCIIIIMLFLMCAPDRGNNISNAIVSSIVGRYASMIKIAASFI